MAKEETTSSSAQSGPRAPKPLPKSTTASSTTADAPEEHSDQQQHKQKQQTQPKRERKQLSDKEATRMGYSFIATVSALILIAAMVFASRKSVTSSDSTDDILWWKKGTIYQIYPRSFQDSDNDGIGDLKGITTRLPYLKQLGIDTVWLSPIFTSPQADFGYDISDFTDIDPDFGTMKDFDSFLKQAHKLDLKVLLDFVPNHSSKEHPWFLESKSSRNNPKRNWYIWADGIVGADGNLHPPNNWVSIFGGSAWEFDNTTNQFYYHEFLVDQPDLNYRNPEVLKAMQDVLVYWLDKGVDGFRVDAFAFVHETTDLKDEPPNTHPVIQTQYDELLHIYTYNLPEAHDVAHAFRTVLDRYDNRFMIGEIYLPMVELLEYYGKPDKLEFHMPFNFLLLEMFRVKGGFNAHNVSTLINAYIASLPEGATPNTVYSNHDNPRVVSQLNDDISAAKCAYMLLLTLPGVPTIYYGDEIAMHDVPVANCSDPASNQCRDPERTPMQWNSEVPNAGFTGKHVKPWLPVAEDSKKNNVEYQLKDSKSTLNMFINVLKLRKDEPALHAGSYIQLNSTNTEVFAFGRQYGSSTFYIICNLHKSKQTATITGGETSGSMVFDAQDHHKVGSKINLKNLHLHPWQSILIKV